MTATGPRRVRFTLTKPLATFLSDLDFGIVSATALGAGPYSVRELTPQHVLLDRNPYYPTPAKLPHVDIRTVRNDAARTLMLVGGSADLAQNAVRLDLIDDVAERARIRVTSAPSVILTYLMMNNAVAPFTDVRVRRAIALALDRPAIIRAKLGGRAVLATGLLPPAHWAYNGEVARYDRDLAKARQLLDEAGLVDPDGAGPLPRISLTYKTSTDAFRVMLAKLLAAQLGEVGIDVEVR
ncbi:MAG: ABC transporter substrate-binding protein [Proteobacteria bacterium]|nr:ABC transporter substrate-binding protein [Pseudomonadota bacterium]